MRTCPPSCPPIPTTNNCSDPLWNGPAYARTVARPTRQHLQGIRSPPPPIPTPRRAVLTKTVYTSGRTHLPDHQRADQSGPLDAVLPHLHLSPNQVDGAGHWLPFGRLDAMRHHHPARPMQADGEDLEFFRARGTYFPTPLPLICPFSPTHAFRLALLLTAVADVHQYAL